MVVVTERKFKRKFIPLHPVMCRRMSVTNAMDVLRDRLRAAIKRRQADEEESWAESGLATIG